jgi:TPR repeat protein/serine/threonine protein kinase
MSKYKTQKQIKGFNQECEQWIKEAKMLERKGKDKKRMALALLEKACAADYPLGWYEVACAYMPGNFFGLNLHDKGASTELFNKIKESAREGNAIAEYALGLMHERGTGVERDIRMALSCYLRSAKQGYIAAQNNVGKLYEEGNEKGGITQNYQKAAKWYRRSAKQGSALGQFLLGELYKDNCIGSYDSLKEAVLWYREAVIGGEKVARDRLNSLKDKGHPEAECVYGELRLIDTLMGYPDYAVAYNYLERAEKQGHRRARCYLGLMYEYGLVEHKPPSLQAAVFLYLYHTKIDMSFGLQQILMGLCYLRRIKHPHLRYEDVAYDCFTNSGREISELSYRHYQYAPFIKFLETVANEGKHNQGKHSASVLLAIIYAGGLLGVEKNQQLARSYLEVLKNQGDPWIQYSIGYYYKQGLLFEQDHEQAHEWYQLAAAQGLEKAEEELKIDPNKRNTRTISSFPMNEPLPWNIRMHWGAPAAGEFPSDPSSEGAKTVEVTHNFVAQNRSQLSIKKGEILRVIRQKTVRVWESLWWHCENSAKREGLVPSNYIRVVERNPDVANTKAPHDSKEIDKNKLTVVKKLGEGAFGVVSEVKFLDGTKAAMKESKLQVDKETRKEILNEFKKELQLIVNLNHRNIVRLYGYTKTEGEEDLPALVMEYMDNGTLHSHFSGTEYDGKRLPYSIRDKIALNIADGVAYLHKEGLIHRDLKSENVLLCNYQGNPYYAKIADFGLSHQQLAESNHDFRSVIAHEIKGTLTFLAPELLQDATHIFRYNKKTDIYALALILFELASYALPYQKYGNMISELTTDLQRGYREPIPKGAPKAFKKAIESGWAQLPEHRPPIEWFIELLGDECKEEQKENKGKESKGKEKEEIVNECDRLEQEKIGPRVVKGFVFRNEYGDDNGNCFYIAVAEQMLKIKHPYLAKETLAGNERWSEDASELAAQLRRHITGYELNEGGQWEWVGREGIAKFAKRTNSIVALIDTRIDGTRPDGSRGPLENGFTEYYSCENRPEVLESCYQPYELPVSVPVLRLGYTGNHYMSVRQHPDLNKGILRKAYKLPMQPDGVSSVVNQNEEGKKREEGAVADSSTHDFSHESRRQCSIGSSSSFYRAAPKGDGGPQSLSVVDDSNKPSALDVRDRIHTLWNAAKTGNDSDAKKELKKLAKELNKLPDDDGYAQYAYGVLMLQPTAEREYKQAFKYLDKAVNKGQRNARYYLGLLYEYGCGVNASLDAAFEHYRSNNLYLGKILLGLYYLRGFDNPLNKRNIATEKIMEVKELFKEASENKKGFDNNITNDYSVLLSFLEEQAQNEKLGALALLAIVHQGGFLGVEKNPSKANIYFERIKKMGKEAVRLASNLGEMYQKGLWFEQSDDKATEWLQLAATHGGYREKYKLGNFLFDDLGKKSEGQRWLSKAEKQENLKKENEAVVSSSSFLIERNLDKGKEEMVDEFHEPEQDEYGDDDGILRESYELPMRPDEFSSINNLGMLYEGGNEKAGIAQNYQKAAKWYRRSAAQGSALGQFLLGRLYEENRIKSHDSLTDAVLLYRKAVIGGEKAARDRLDSLKDRGHPEAQYVYGKLRLTNTFMGYPDYAVAYYYINRAAEQGYLRARHYLEVTHGENSAKQEGLVPTSRSQVEAVVSSSSLFKSVPNAPDQCRDNEEKKDGLSLN